MLHLALFAGKEAHIIISFLVSHKKGHGYASGVRRLNMP